MNRSTTICLISTAFILGTTELAQTSTQVGAQANGQASVQADRTHAQASGGTAASSSASAQSDQTNAGLASGTAFNATLTAPVDSKKSKPGDTVTARTTEIVKSDGKAVVPKGTTLVGHVTQASARAKGDAESALAITFDRAILKHGQEVPLNVAIRAMAAAQTTASATDADLDTMGSSGAGAAGSGMAGARGAGAGLTSVAGSAVGSVNNTAGGTGEGTLHSAVSSTTGVAGTSSGGVGGLSSTGQLMSNSRGVLNMNGLTLNTAAANGSQGSVITSAGKNVHLDGGTRLLLVTEATASATPNR